MATWAFIYTPEERPGLSSRDRDKIKLNDDGSVTLYIGPKAPKGYENNWVQTVPGKSWSVILRLYGPLEAWYNKTWRPGEIEWVK
ncbi:MAG: DUF1214 domain-containing protein [Deltaproteobacteria bacterium]|nr:DUF1214 domain-containing protein [Deltaproteobacteria bacterium]